MSWLRFAVILIAACAACGAPAARVDVPQQAAPACTPADLDGEPLVVDLDPSARADLESALSRGVVAVKYDCDGVKVLPDCVAPGKYAYVGVTEKEQLVRFSSGSELRANFPTGAARLERERAGRAVDFGVAIVGTLNAQRTPPARADFAGRCNGATHFARRVTVGGFGIGFAQPNAKTTLDAVLGAGEAHDGSIQACRAATAASESAPPSCTSALRLVLDPIGASAPPTEERHRRCRGGTVLDDQGECRAPGTIAFHLCDPANLPDCEAQCVKGSMGSCAIAGRSYELGRGVPVDLARAKTLLTRACEGGSAQGCGRLGEVRLLEGAPADARALFDKSCASGWLGGCESLGQSALSAPGAKVDVLTLFKRACIGGNYDSCASLGKLYETGLGAPQSDAEAVRLYTLACDSGATRRACVSLSVMVERGRGTAADPARAVAILERACEHGSSDSCGMLSLHYFEGRGVARDHAKGMAFLVRACEGDDRGSCLPLAMRYQAGIGVPKDPDRAKTYFTRACDAGITIACQQVRQ